MSFNRCTYLCNCHHNLQNTIPKMFIFLYSQFPPTISIPRRPVICFLSPQTSLASLASPINGIIQYELLLWLFFYIAQCFLGFFFRIIHVVACVVLVVYSFLSNCQTMSQIVPFYIPAISVKEFQLPHMLSQMQYYQSF